MILTADAYRDTVRRIKETQTQLVTERRRLEAAGHPADEIKRLLDPTRAAIAGMQDELDAYERTSRVRS